MNRVRGCVSGARGQRLRLNHLHDLRIARIRLGVDDMDARRVDARHHQVAAFHMGMRSVRAQAGAACVPAEMMQLVAGMRHVHLADDMAVAGGCGIDVHDAHRVVTAVILSVDHRDVRQLFSRRIHGHLGRRVERGIGTPNRHFDNLLNVRLRNSDPHESGGYKSTGVLTLVLRVRQFHKLFVERDRWKGLREESGPVAMAMLGPDD